MPLHKIKEFDSDYRQHFNGHDILKFDVYSGSEKVGSVDDLLLDDAGQFRYWVINTGAWIVGKKVLLPVGRARIDEGVRRVYADGLTRDQVKSLPEYKGDPVDYDYEERVRNVYRPMVVTREATSAPVSYDRHSYRYDRDPALYSLNDREHKHLRQSETQLMSRKPRTEKHRRAVGVFPERQSAEQALHELRDSGFPMERVSIVTRDADKHDEIAGADVREHVGNKADEGAAIGAVSGGALGGLTGLLVGLGSLAIPGVGPIMLAGTVATALATTLAGGAIGAVSGGLLGALIGLGIPEERARVYQDRIARGGYLVIVDGTDAEIARAETFLHRRGIEDYGVYDAPDRTSTHIQDVPPPAPTSTHIQDAPTRVPAERTATAASIPTTSIPTTRTATTRTTTTPTTSVAPPATSPVTNPVTNRAASGRRSAVGFFSNLTDAEQAVADLRSIGFPLNQLTIAGHQFQRRDHFAGVDLRDRFEAARLRIPVEQARLYNDRINRGDYMVIVHGNEDELNRAAPVLNRRGIQEWRVYDPTAVNQELPVEAPRSTASIPVSSPVSPAASAMNIEQSRHAVGFFSHRRDAEQAIADLREARFPLGQVSLVAQRFEQREPFAGVDLHDRFDNRHWGFSEDRVRFLDKQITRGDYLVVIRGTHDQLRQAEAILNRPRIHDFSIYDTSKALPRR